MRKAMATLATLLPMWAIGADNWDWAAPHKARCSGGNATEMYECMGKELQAVELRLNEKYRDLLAYLARPEDLRRSQRAWLAFREETCAFSVSGLQGSGGLHSFALASCKIDLTEKRIRDLVEYSEWSCNGCPLRK